MQSVHDIDEGQRPGSDHSEARLSIAGPSPRMVLALWRRGVVGAIMYRNGATRLPLLVEAYAARSVELRLSQQGHAFNKSIGRLHVRLTF